MEAGAAAGTRYEPTQEVRFAVVMYGGVSLAIYINGVVQELLHLVRATAPAEPPTEDGLPESPLVPDGELEETEAVYRDLGRILRHGPGAKYTDAPGTTEPIRTRFVVDILSGSSAGGINGVFLAKALANHAPLAQLKQLWVSEGDIVQLINDDESYAGTKLERKPPDSVLNSRRMYWLLLKAFRDMDKGSQDPGTRSRLVDELDLWITATDLNGLMLPIGLYDRVVYEPRYRNLFHFRYANPYSSDTSQQPENQLAPENNPVLAFAARATSSFPFAFEPMELAAIDPIVANEEFSADYGSRPSSAEAWQRFFRPYIVAEGPQSTYATRQYGDGGYLDNKPFTAPTANLLVRRADLPVDRKLIYVEPDPGTVHASPVTPGQPPLGPVPPDRELPLKRFDPLQNVLAALISLPRKEPIREDLELLLQRNRDVARLSRAIQELDAAIEESAGSPDDALEPLDKQAWLDATPQKLARKYGFQYAAYQRLRLALLLDDLAETATILADFDPSSDERSALRCFIGAWFRDAYPEPEDAKGFLAAFDLPYRLRRIDFVQSRIDELLADGDPAAKELYALKRDLTTIFVRLLRGGRGVRLRDGSNPAFAAFEQLDLKRDALLSVLEGTRSESESVEKARALLGKDPELMKRIGDLADRVRESFEPVFAESDVRAALAARATAAPDAIEKLTTALDRYQLYDSVILPISFGSIGESDRVEVIRVSPEDATAIVDEVKTGRRKLGGIQLGHFGGFFRKDWRENDLLWGRLDGAERIVAALLGPEDATADVKAALIKRAHRAIVRAELGLDSDEAADKELERLRDTDVDRDVPAGEMQGVVGRAAAVTGEVLERTKSGGPLLQRLGDVLELGGETETGTGRIAALAFVVLVLAVGGVLLGFGLADSGTALTVVGSVLLGLALGVGTALVLVRRAAGRLGRAPAAAP